MCKKKKFSQVLFIFGKLPDRRRRRRSRLGGRRFDRLYCFTIVNWHCRLTLTTTTTCVTDCGLVVASFPQHFIGVFVGASPAATIIARTDNHLLFVMMMIVMVGRREPLTYHNWLPDFLPTRHPNFLPCWHPNLLPVFLPLQLLIGHMNQLFTRHPNLFPVLFPREFL